MEVELPKVKEDFATIVESITLQPWTMLQFIIWLDLKLAEYKLNGSMSLDKSVGAIPDWLAGISVDQPEETVEPPKQQMLPPPTHEEENSSDTVITGQEEEEEIPEEYEDDEIYEDEILPNSDDNLSLSQPPSALSQGHSDLGEDDPEEHEHENNIPVNSESWGPNIASKRPADMRESNKPEMSPSDIKRQKVPQGATMPTMHESFHPEMSPSDKKRPIVPQGASMPMMQEKFHPEMNRSDIKRLNAPQGAPMHMMRKAGAWGTRQNVHGRLEQHSGHVTIVRDPNRATFVGDPNRSTIIRDPNRPHSGNIIYRNPRGGVQSSIIANKVEQSIDQREYFDDDEMFDYNTNPDVMSMGNTGTYASAHRMFANRNRTSNVNREKRVSSTVTSHSVSNVSPFLEMDPLDEEMSPDDEEFDDDPTHITQIAHRGVSRTAVPISSNAKDPIPTQMFVNKQELSKQGPQHHQTEIEPRSSQEETRTDANEPFGNISQSENSENFDQSLNFPGDFQIKTEPEDPTDLDESGLQILKAISLHDSQLNVFSTMIDESQDSPPASDTQTSNSELNTLPLSSSYSIKKNELQCIRCEVTFPDHNQLHDHVPECALRKFRCGQCGKEYNSRPGRDKHRIQVHDRSGKYECPVCGKTFHSKSHIDGHISGHYKRFPYKCSRCQATYRYKYDLTSHEKRKCKYNDYKCESCPLVFQTEEMLNEHQVTVHA